MVRYTATVIVMALFASSSADAQTLVISRSASRPVRPAPAQNFTGSVQVEMLFEAVDPSHASGGSISFEPGARTAWHSHPRGQVLIITAGTARVQRWGDPIEEVRAGDVVRIPAGQKHWHGAAPHASMTHLAVSEHRDGSTVQWMEQVSDEQYNGLPWTPQPQPPNSQPGIGRPSGPLQQKLAPGMAALTDDVLYGDVWRRPDLSPRDRSLVTITALIAMGKTTPLAGHLGRALDNGVRPTEASGLLAHLAIYCGWPSAVAAIDAYRAGVHRAEGRHRRTAGREPAPPGSRWRRGTNPSRCGGVGGHRAEVRATHQRRGARRSLASLRPVAAGSQPGHHRCTHLDG